MLGTLALALAPGAQGSPEKETGESVLLSCDTTVGRVVDTLFGGQRCSQQQALPRQQLQVILAGMARSGTSSLKVALERLGYAAVHGSEIYNYPRMQRAIHYAKVAPLALLEEIEVNGFNATLEATSPFWTELFALRPQAKVILLQRSFEGWYASVCFFIGNWVLKQFPFYDVAIQNFFAHLTGDIDECVWGDTCALGSAKHRALLQGVYDRTISQAHDLVPPEQLLVLKLEAGDGYPELCRFLGVESSACPDEPFPRINGRTEIEALVRFVRVVQVVVCLLAVLLGYLCWSWAYNRGKAAGMRQCGAGGVDVSASKPGQNSKGAKSD